MHLHSERMFILYQLNLPIEIINLIDKEIKNSASTTIVTSWYKTVNSLITIQITYNYKTDMTPIIQEDINLIFALKKLIKNKYIKLDYIFWNRIVNKIRKRLDITNTVIIGDTIYNEHDNSCIIYFYFRILNDLSILLSF